MTLYDKIYKECEADFLDQDAIKAICDEHDQQLAGLERNCQILMRSACPEKHWCAPDEPSDEILELTLKALYMWEHFFADGVFDTSQEECDESNRQLIIRAKEFMKTIRAVCLKRKNHEI
jgi:hypothetical protein